MVVKRVLSAAVRFVVSEVVEGQTTLPSQNTRNVMSPDVWKCFATKLDNAL